MEEKIKILFFLFKKKLKYILFFYIFFLYKEVYALENINKSIILDNKIFINNNKIQDIIKYESDIIKYDLYKTKSYLIGNASITYNNILIKANYIEINWQKYTIYANYKYNKFISEPDIRLKKILIIYNNKKYYCDNFFLNLKTQVGIGNNFLYEDKHGIIISKNIKKIKDKIFIMKESFYTNDRYFKTKKDFLSDYFLKTKFIKHLNNKLLITGPILMYLYQIPTPIFIPFLYINTDTKSSLEFLTPHFGKKNNNDFFIENLGFFSSILNNWNIRVAGSIYYKNYWRIDTKTRYNFKYKYSGNIDINYQNFFKKQNKLNNLYEIKWNHIEKNKNFTFYTDINYINNKNNYKEKMNINNIINDSLNSNISSINLKKNFEIIPLRLLISNNLSHDLNKKYITMNLPKITLTLDKINPFKNNNYLKNLNFYYNINIKNILNYEDKYLFSKNMFKIMTTNFEQDLLINTKIDIFNYFKIIPNITYNENIMFLINKNYYNIFFLKNFINIFNNKLKIFRKFKLELNLFFTLYGLKIFKSNSIIKALRHKIDTQIIYLYYPRFTKYYNNNYMYNSINNYININNLKKIKFLFSNNLQAKIKEKNNNDKKINLIDSFNIYTTYNISKNLWSDIFFNGNTTIKNFIFDISGRVYINKNNINFCYKKIAKINDFRILSLRYYWMDISYKIDNYLSKKRYNIYKKKGEIRYENFFFDEKNYAHYKIFWNLNLNFNYNYFLYNNIINKGVLLKLDGNIYPTPFWRIGINLDYDIINKKIINALFIFDRDLRSFKIKFIWSTNNIWYFYLGINSQILNKL